MNTIDRTNERGSARLKFIVVMAILCVVAYSGYLYIPVAYQAFLFKDLMQHDVDAATALSHPTNWVTEQLVKSGPEYGVPPDATITTTQEDKRMQVRVQFTRPIEFPGFTYHYEFDHTAKATEFQFK
jgi:hypothetical protein